MISKKKKPLRIKEEWSRREGKALFGNGPKVDPMRKAAAMDAIRKEIRHKKTYYTPSFTEICRTELSLISVHYWCLQVLLLYLGVWLACRADGRYLSGILQSGPGGAQEVLILPALSALLALVGVTGFAEFSKSFACRMAELEQSCFLNLRQLLAARMGITGLVNILLLGCFIGVSQGRLQAGLLRISIYLLTPYVWSLLLYFTAFTFVRGGGKLMQVSVLFAACALSFLPVCIPGIYGSAALGLWAAALLGAGTLLGTELVYLTKELERGENICWN